jgi:hypothetical protein
VAEGSASQRERVLSLVEDRDDRLYANPYLGDWEHRLRGDNRQHWRDRWSEPQGVGMDAIPSAPRESDLRDRKTEMHFVGGLIAVSQRETDLASIRNAAGRFSTTNPLMALANLAIALQLRDRG